MKAWTVAQCAVAAWLTATAVAGAQPGQSVTLPVKHIHQEAFYWCWAAAAQMLMDYAEVSVCQCEQANVRVGRTDCCTGGAVPTYCDRGGRPLFAPFGVTGRVASSLSEREVEEALANRRSPFMIRWDYSAGQSHYVVVHGVTYLGGVLNVLILDPQPGVGELGPLLPYNDLLVGPGYTLGEVIHDVRRHP